MRVKYLVLFNALGVLILLSWAWPTLSLWTTLDDDIFWFFNQYISTDHGYWVRILAVLNTRAFDAFSFAVMALLFGLAMMRDPHPRRLSRWLGIGVTMLLIAGVIALFTLRAISYGHPSPTRFFQFASHLTDIVSIPTKDSAGNSFPGDHGLMLMIFAAFMLRFAEARLAWLSVLFVVLLSAPRIMVGAHWFSDIYMGSLSMALIVLPWLLCTPAAARCATWISGKSAGLIDVVLERMGIAWLDSRQGRGRPPRAGRAGKPRSR